MAAEDDFAVKSTKTNHRGLMLRADTPNDRRANEATMRTMKRTQSGQNTESGGDPWSLACVCVPGRIMGRERSARLGRASRREGGGEDAVSWRKKQDRRSRSMTVSRLLPLRLRPCTGGLYEPNGIVPFFRNPHKGTRETHNGRGERQVSWGNRNTNKT